jgi:glycosyltransferase involved in cell wall biosynthesis
VTAPLPLAVVVIAKNEQAVIGRCISSVLPGRWATEVLLVDSGSTDSTTEIARSLGAQVHTADWRGPATQRNRGIALTRAPWILCLDADEWLQADLRDEIATVIARADATPAGAAVAYLLPRFSSYCGRFMRHSGWFPDRVGRLSRRGAAHYEGGNLHDKMAQLEARAPYGTLRALLHHEPMPDLERVLGKVNAYSTCGALALVERGERPGLASALLHGLWAFLRTYIVQRGFLDGTEGVMLAISNAEGTYYKYVKAMLAARAAADGGAQEKLTEPRLTTDR